MEKPAKGIKFFPPLFYGWWVVAAASVMGAAGVGITISGFPVFFLPIREDLGISSSAMSLVFSLAWAQSGLVAPLTGWLADRFGTRKLVWWGGLVSGAGLILAARGTHFWHFLLLYGVVVAIGRTAGITPTLMATVNQWFERRKALALSILGTSFTLGGAVLVPLLALGVTHLGWRFTLTCCGIFLIGLTLPATLIIRNRPEDMGLLPDGNSAGNTAGRQENLGAPVRPAVRNQGFSVRQAIATASFWLMLIGIVLRVSVADALIIHQIPILVWKGVAESTAAFYLSLAFALMVPLRFGMGVAGGYVSARLVLFLAMIAGALGNLGLLAFSGTPAVILFVVGLAATEGVSALNWIAVGDYFGRRSFASLVGMMTIFFSAGALLSPVVAGWIFDQTQSYALVLMASSPALLLSGLLFLLARKPELPATT